MWRGWAHGFGRRGQTPALRAAIRAVNPRKGNSAAAPDEFAAVQALLRAVPDESAPPVVRSPVRTNSAAGKLALLAIASLTPKDLSGEPVDIAGSLEAGGLPAVTELVRGRSNDLAARGFWPPGHKGPTGHEPDLVLRSHAINEVSARALRHGDVDGFLGARCVQLQSLVESYLRVKLDPGALVRPPLTSLLVPDVD